MHNYFIPRPWRFFEGKQLESVKHTAHSGGKHLQWERRVMARKKLETVKDTLHFGGKPLEVVRGRAPYYGGKQLEDVMDATHHGVRQLKRCDRRQITAETFMTYNTWDTVEYTTVLLAFRLMFLPVLRQ